MSLTKLKELVLLGTLKVHPTHGYALAEHFESGLGWTVGLTRPTIYATLRRFVDRGWIAGEPVRDSRLPEREVYQVTPKGKKAHQDLLRRCVEGLAEGTHPVAVLLTHVDDLDPEERRAALESLLKQRRGRLAAIEAFPPHDGTAGVALALLATQIRAEIETLSALLG